MKPKFRAWDKEDTQMRDVLAVNFYHRVLSVGYEGDQFAQDGMNRFILMQYTGLKDKNGVEVYFNDIVEDEYKHRYEVVFEGDCLRCNGIRRIRGGHKPKNRWFSKDLEIIGNRYESPELLEEQNK